MKPYFDTHSAGALLLIVLLAWLSMEAIQFVRQWQWRANATRIGRRSFWLGFGACLIVTNLVLYLGPSAFPAAAIRPGAVAFAAGIVIMVTGVVLRGWSFYALGQYFTAVIKVSPDQPVVRNGPYRLLRHPSYAGGLLAEVGIAVTAANWVSVAVFVVAWVAIIAWRIHIEETALLSALGDRYRSYASHCKRLIPLAW
jgi:protein-S-isoprenylcysteine O-methyltransferase Ste14